MNPKDVLQSQLYRVQRVAMPVSLILLTLNLSLTAYGFVGWRGGSPYMVIMVIFIGIALLILVLANVNMLLLQMHVPERRAQIRHNPTAVYAFTPQQIMMQRRVQIPMLEALGLHGSAERLARWSRLGYIPKDEYDPDLLTYYHDKGAKL